jgi:hypothetical protein
MEHLVEEGLQGHTSILPTLRCVFDQVHALQEVLSLAERIKNAWLDAITGQNLLTREALERETRTLSASLSTTTPSALEAVLIDTVITTWLAWKQAELSAAEQLKTYRIALTQQQENHLTSCHKRFLASMRELARLRTLLTPKSQLQINISDNAMNFS